MSTLSMTTPVPTLSLVLPRDYETEMTIAELLSLSSQPRLTRTNRRMNIAYNRDAIAELKQDIEHEQESRERNAMDIENADATVHSAGLYLVYSNGLLLTPEGEIAMPEEYNITDAEIQRQVVAHKNQTGMEEADECIITLDFPTFAEKADLFTTPALRTPILTRRSVMSSVVSTDDSLQSGIEVVFIEDSDDYEPVDLYISEFQGRENMEFIYHGIM